MYIAIDESKGITCRTAKLLTYVMKKAILLYTGGLILVGQTAFASTNPQPAINKLSVLTNAVIRGQAPRWSNWIRLRMIPTLGFRHCQITDLPRYLILMAPWDQIT